MELCMETERADCADLAHYPIADRVGFARLTTMAFDGADLRPMRDVTLAAAMDMGGNTPIEFLLEHSGIELVTLYVVDDVELPMPLPAHDVAIVIASDSEECRAALRKIERSASRWPRPLLNPPQRVGNLDRDKLHRLLSGIKGLDIPATEAVTRVQLSALVLPQGAGAD